MARFAVFALALAQFSVHTLAINRSKSKFFRILPESNLLCLPNCLLTVLGSHC